MKKAVLLAFVFLFLIPLTFVSQASTEENFEYVYPAVSFSGVQLNATAYRLQSGDTINLTFSFTTYEFVNFSLPEYYNTYHSIPGGDGGLNESMYVDGIQGSIGYRDLGLKGGSSSLSQFNSFLLPGNHTIEWKWLFTVEEDGPGYLDIDFYGVKLILPKAVTVPIYIRADGNVDPSDAPISSVDNVTYTFASDINDSIIIERDNIVIDGAGYTLQGTGSGKGTSLLTVNNVTVSNTKIKGFNNGILLFNASYCIISGNNLTNNGDGIVVFLSSNNNFSRNDVTNNQRGITLTVGSKHNTIQSNNILANTEYGILSEISSSDNKIYHNNFINNSLQVQSSDAPWETPSTNIWDNNHPSGGNYWSNYNGTDSDGDDIGDTPYIIDENNQDRYPLINPWTLTWNPETSVESPFWMEWWFWAIVAVVVVVLVGAIYLLKRGKPPISTVPPLPSERIT